MAEYINRKRARFEAKRYFKDMDEIQEDLDMLFCMLPAENVAPVRNGWWVSVPHKLARVCSVCNRDEPYKFADIDADVYDYCPNCGAKMDGGVE